MTRRRGDLAPEIQRLQGAGVADLTEIKGFLLKLNKPNIKRNLPHNLKIGKMEDSLWVQSYTHLDPTVIDPGGCACLMVSMPATE